MTKCLLCLFPPECHFSLLMPLLTGHCMCVLHNCYEAQIRIDLSFFIIVVKVWLDFSIKVTWLVLGKDYGLG